MKEAMVALRCSSRAGFFLLGRSHAISDNAGTKTELGAKNPDSRDGTAK
jgi:hypothetical protein